MQSTDTSQLTTDAPQVTVLDTLRSVGVPTETLRVVPPITPGPRPAQPKQRLTARPLPRDLYDGNHADLAFGAA